MTSPNLPLADDLDELAALARAARMDRFRVRAYERVARLVRALPLPVADLRADELRALAGVGAASAGMIAEHAADGRIALLEELRRREPPGVGALLVLPLIGLPDARRLVDAGIGDVAGLAAAAAAPGGLDGLDARLARRVHEALRRLPTQRDPRTPLPVARRDALALADGLTGLAGVREVLLAGAVRRRVERVGELALVLVVDAHAANLDLGALPGIVRVLDRSAERTRVLASSGRAAEVWPSSPAARGAVLLRATGPPAHLDELAARPRSQVADRVLTGGRAQGDESQVYAELGLPAIPPELRGTGGEVDAAAAGALPALVRHGDLQGDLHVHSDFSGDGTDSVEEMVRGAAGRGYAYVALTDHAELLTINGMPREAVLARRRTIAELQQRFAHLQILDGAELNIGLDGALDYDLDFLLRFDLCVASVHSDMDRDAAAQTERILAAVAHPAVHVIGHPTGRILSRRPGYAIDLEAIAQAAAETGTALEVNGSPARLDLDGAMARAAVRAGALLSLSSDAHSLDELDAVAHAVGVARRGWAEVADVLNARSPAELRAFTAAKRDRDGR